DTSANVIPLRVRPGIDHRRARLRIVTGESTHAYDATGLVGFGETTGSRPYSSSTRGDRILSCCVNDTIATLCLNFRHSEISEFMRLQFSLRGLIVGVVMLSYALGALRYASPWWAAVSFSFALVVLIAGSTCSATRKGTARLYWIGFALSGWTYFALVFAPWF